MAWAVFVVDLGVGRPLAPSLDSNRHNVPSVVMECLSGGSISFVPSGDSFLRSDGVCCF